MLEELLQQIVQSIVADIQPGQANAAPTGAEQGTPTPTQPVIQDHRPAA